MTLISMLVLIHLMHINVKNSLALPKDEGVTFDALYKAGVEAYGSQRWFECTNYFRAGIEDFKFYYQNVADCRQRCKNEFSSDTGSGAIPEILFFDTVLERSHCIEKCKQKRFGNRPEVNVPEDVYLDFVNLMPYNYLQMCAYKV